MKEKNQKLVRFNFERELDKEAWDYLQDIDSEKFSSVNDYLLNAIATFGRIQKSTPLTEEQIRESMEEVMKVMLGELLEGYNDGLLHKLKELIESGTADRYLFDYALRNMEIY